MLKVELPATAALALAIGWLFYSIPLVRHLVWLNAAAISVHFQKPGLFIPLGIFGVLAIMGTLGLLLWFSYQHWKETRHV